MRTLRSFAAVIVGVTASSVIVMGLIATGGSPTRNDWSSADETARVACTTMEAASSLFVATVSATSPACPVRTALFTMVSPPVPRSTVAVRPSVSDVPAIMEPTVQTPVPSS
jgi:hypothetical protein